jgi:hypothetical protein
MAEIVQIDIPGIGLVDARNAASEKTLSEILKILEEFDKKMLKGAGKGSGGAGGTGSGSGGAAPAAGSSFGKILANAGEKAKFVGFAFAELANQSTKTVNQLANLGDSLSNVAALFPGFIGSMFSAVASASEKVVNSYNNVAQSGASFGGSINNFASAASKAGMTMDQFGDLIRSNSQGMLAFGSTVESGAKRFVDVSKQLRATGSELYALGFSTQEINKGLASYGELLRKQGMQGTKSNADLASGANRYLKNLDALAKITGEERAAKEAEMKRLAQSAQFQAAMAGLSDDVRESFMMTVGQLPQGMQKFAEDIMATGTATTEENQKLLAMMPQSAALLTEFNAKQQRGEAITLEERNKLNNLMKQEGGAALQSIKQAGAANAELAPLVNSLASTYEINTDAVKNATEEQKTAKAATDKVNEAINKMRERIAQVSNAFTMILVNSGVLNTMMSIFEGLVSIISTFVVPIFTFMAGVIKTVVDVFQNVGGIISTLIAPIFTSMAGAMKNVGDIFQNAGGIIESFVKPALLTLAGFIIADVVPIFETLKDWVTIAANAIETYVWPALESIGTLIQTHVWPALESIGTFIANNLSPIMLGLATAALAYYGYLGALKVAEMARIATTWLANGGLVALAGSVWAAVAPFIPLVAAVAGIVGLFIYLYKTGWSFGTAIEAVKDNLSRFWLTLVDAVNGLLSIIPNALGGISKEEAERRKAANDVIRKDLDEKEKLRDTEREEVAKGRSDEAKSTARQNAVKDMSFKLDQKRLGQQQDSIKAAEKEKELNLSDPYALLKGLGEKEKTGFIKDQSSTPVGSSADQSRTALVNDAERRAAEEKRIKDEEKIKAQANSNEAAKGTTTAKTPAEVSQESMIAVINKLNSNMERMVAFQAKTNSILDTQLSVQQGFSSNLSNDLFA